MTTRRLADAVTPPAFGEWYARELPAATLDIAPGAAHYLLLTRWADILGTLVADADAMSLPAPWPRPRRDCRRTPAPGCDRLAPLP